MTAGMLAALSLVYGCQTTQALFSRGSAQTSEQVGNIYVSAYPAVPWPAIADKLAPANNLTIDQARGMAATTTQWQVDQFLSTFALGLGLTLPGTSETSSTTTATGASGTQTGTQSTRTSASGAVPASSGLPASTVAGLTPDLTKGPGSTGLNGSTLLTAGTALYQQAQILDNQIAKEILPGGFQAHLLTFQVNLQPEQRNLAYDAYTDIVLLPGNWSRAVEGTQSIARSAAELPLIKVYPLIITDALEAASVGRSVQAIRQAAVQLSGLVGGKGLNAGLAKGSNLANSVVGLDQNSLVTAGRVNDNMIRVRIGAENSGSAGLALVPRSYNISVVVLTKWDKDDPNRQLESLAVVAHTHFKSVDGKEVKSGPTRSRAALAKKTKDLLRSFYITALHPVDADGQAITLKKDTAKDDNHLKDDDQRALELLRAVDRGDYWGVANALPAKLPGGPSGEVLGGAGAELTLERLLPLLEEEQADSRYSTLQVSLQKRDKRALPPGGQLAVFEDDRKRSAAVTLRGGTGLYGEKIGAKLVFKQGQYLLPATLTVAGEGELITAAFVSPGSLEQADELADKPIVLWFIDGGGEERYAVAKVKSATADNVANPVSATQEVLVAASDGTASVTLAVGDLGKVTGVTLPLHLEVSGADVRAGKPESALVSKQALTLGLGNLTPAKPVIIKTADKDGKPVGVPLQFQVDRVSGG